ncbi:hypothetical protein F2Q68_00045011 [Brassica cretica]|uniref:Uncharacterized protein n=1 Tax=Brassica cretica TaxID=69181 RepID=A0A8S9LWK6_BRACR|nr:hypothetical protein F2Q68_00045011 [Brassica cretica]
MLSAQSESASSRRLSRPKAHDKEVPPEFTHRAKGNSITISKRTLSAFSRFKACLLLSPFKELTVPSETVYRLRCKESTCLELEATLREIQFEFSCNSEISRIIECGVQMLGRKVNKSLQSSLTKPQETREAHPPPLLPEHLLVLRGALFKERICVEVDSNIQFEFSCNEKHSKIIECVAKIMAVEGESSSRDRKKQSDGAIKVSKDENIVKTNKHACWWSGL